MELYEERPLYGNRVLELETDYAGRGRVLIYDAEACDWEKVWPIESMWKARLRFFFMSLLHH